MVGGCPGRWLGRGMGSCEGILHVHVVCCLLRVPPHRNFARRNLHSPAFSSREWRWLSKKKLAKVLEKTGIRAIIVYCRVPPVNTVWLERGENGRERGGSCQVNTYNNGRKLWHQVSLTIAMYLCINLNKTQIVLYFLQYHVTSRFLGVCKLNIFWDTPDKVERGNAAVDNDCTNACFLQDFS